MCIAIAPELSTMYSRISDLVMLPNQQLARRIIALSLRANELSNAVQLSKEHMAKVRQDKIKAIRVEKQNCQFRIAEQKNHLESVVVRHQGFIEQVCFNFKYLFYLSIKMLLYQIPHIYIYYYYLLYASHYF